MVIWQHCASDVSVPTYSCSFRALKIDKTVFKSVSFSTVFFSIITWFGILISSFNLVLIILRNSITMTSSTQTDFQKVYKELRQNGACKLCSYRFLCNAEYGSLSEKYLETVRLISVTFLENISFTQDRYFVTSLFSIIQEGYEDPPNDVKVKKTNTCIICLGAFEARVVEEVKERVNVDLNSIFVVLTTSND